MSKSKSNFEVDLIPGEIIVTLPKNGASQCLSCARYRGDRPVAGPCCQAYPGGIPTQIFTNQVKHDKHLPDDGGLYYVEDDDDLSVELALASDPEFESKHPRDDEGQFTEKTNIGGVATAEWKAPKHDKSIKFEPSYRDPDLQLDNDLVAHILGIQPDSRVSYYSAEELTEDDEGNESYYETGNIVVEIRNKKYHAYREIDFDNSVIINQSITVAKPYAGQGLGTKILYDQVKGAKEAGFDRIETDAVRMKEFNGYYTWARLGFDQQIDRVNLTSGWKPHWKKYGNKLSDVMKTQAGRDDWKAHGDGFYGIFDLNDKHALAVLTAARRAKDHDAIALSFDESLHPRSPSGSSKGGEFTSKGGGGGTATKEKPIKSTHVPSDQISTGPGFDRAFESRQELQDYMDSWRPDLGNTNTDYFAQALYPLNTGANWKPGVMQIYNTNVDFFQSMFPSFKIVPPETPATQPPPRSQSRQEVEDDDEIYDDDEDPAVFDEESHGEIDGVKWSWEFKEDVDDPDRILEQLEPADIIALVGAQKGADVEFTVTDIDSDAGEFEVQVSVTHPKYSADRLIKMGSYGETVIENESFFVNKEFQKQGLGAKVLYEQVKAAKALGFTELRTHSIRDPKANGYYTWPRLGYDVDLADIYISDEAIVDSLKKFGTRISDVMKTQEGRDYWREKGVGADLVFDLKSKKALKVLTAAHREHYPEALALSLCLSGIRLTLANPYHEPAGSSKGGEFAKSPGGIKVTSAASHKLRKTNFNARQLAELVGAQKDAKVEIGDIPGQKQTFTLTVSNEKYYQYRIVDLEELIIRNASFEVNEPYRGQGLGTKILYDQVQAAKQYNFKYITTEAVRDNHEDSLMVGYYAWPRLGFDANFEIDVIDNDEIRNELEDNNQFRLSDLMKTEKGRKAWKKNGYSLEVSFDLSNKNSLAILTAAHKAHNPNALALASTAFVEAEHPRDEIGRFAEKESDIPYKFNVDAMFWGAKYREDSYSYDPSNPINDLIASWTEESEAIRVHELIVGGNEAKEFIDYNRKAPTKPVIEEMRNVVDDWTEFLDSAPTWDSKDGDLYRGIELPLADEKKWTTIDNVVTFYSSQSATNRSRRAEAFGSTLLIVKNTTGAVPFWATLDKNDSNRFENEFILRKGKKYRIADIQHNLKGDSGKKFKHVITLEEIAQSNTLSLASAVAFDESKHKRQPAGSEKGGEFASKDAGSTITPENIRAGVKKAYDWEGSSTEKYVTSLMKLNSGENYTPGVLWIPDTTNPDFYKAIFPELEMRHNATRLSYEPKSTKPIGGVFKDKTAELLSPERPVNEWARDLRDAGIEEGAISEWFAESSAIRKTELVMQKKEGLEDIDLPAFKPDASWKADVKEFHKLLDSAPDTKYDALYRGLQLPPDALKDWTTVGNVVTLHTTQSASESSAIARKFGRDLLIVKNPTNAVPIYKLLEEGNELLEEIEVVLRHNKKYKIVGVRQNVQTSGKINIRNEITLEELTNATK